MFEVLVVSLPSLPGIDPLEASQVFGLIPLHLLHNGCLALTQFLRPGHKVHTHSKPANSDLDNDSVLLHMCSHEYARMDTLFLFNCKVFDFITAQQIYTFAFNRAQPGFSRAVLLQSVLHPASLLLGDLATVAGTQVD